MIKRVQDLVSLLFDKAAQQQAILELSLDSTRLSSVTQSHIKQAMTLLAEIEKAIQLKTIKKSQEQAQQK